jgi:hypothetical protein
MEEFRLGRKNKVLSSLDIQQSLVFRKHFGVLAKGDIGRESRNKRT